METPTATQIKTLRLRAGLSQIAACTLVHSALSTWQGWEYGRRKMHPAIWELFQIKVERVKQ